VRRNGLVNQVSPDRKISMNSMGTLLKQWDLGGSLRGENGIYKSVKDFVIRPARADRGRRKVKLPHLFWRRPL